jgi:hypothetical protein
MADGRAKNGGARAGAGRKPKVVEDAQQSILLAEFNADEERLAVRAVITRAKRGDVAAFKELMDRKYGKVKEHVEQVGEMIIRYEYVDTDTNDPETDTP